MKIIFFLALMVMTSTAQAECLQWGRTLRGDRVCMMDDAVNHNPVIPETLYGPLTGGSGMTITATPAPKCDDGWTLVADLMMRPICARELRSPQ